MKAYPELAKIFGTADEDTIGKVQYTSEFTDSSPSLEKSFAITTTVRLRNPLEVGEKYQYKTLMLLIKSSYINELIADNNDTNILNTFDYSNIIVDDDGNYVISNSQFQGTNFFDYIELYNDEFSKEEKSSLMEQLQGEDYSTELYFKNNREEDCVYMIVPVQNSDWHILSIVPLSSFRSSYDFKGNFLTFAAFFALLFLVDIFFVLLINYRLRIKTKEAEAANQSKSIFLSSMSHDIRTPMNAIIGMALIADQQLKEEVVDRAVLCDCIKSIELSGNHLLTLINDILDLSKIESGRIVLSQKDFSVVDVLNNVITLCGSGIRKKEFDFQVSTQNVAHAYVTGDALRVNQIFINILTNAVKYTEDGGKIRVELTEKPIEGQTDRAKYVYRVSDTGIGMSEEFMETIFERFTRAVDTRINSVQGTGLGMSIVKQLVDLMDGSIQVESELNHGSSFTVTLILPIAKEQIEKIETQQVTVPVEETVERDSFKDIRILVAEDNDTNWKVFNKILKYYSIRADRAANGQIAVDMVKSSKKEYDLIFMDIQMPVMNGYEATKAIRSLEDEQKAGISIYAMTADTFASDIEKCTEAGMNGHLPKPIELNRVLEIIKIIYEKRV